MSARELPWQMWAIMLVDESIPGTDFIDDVC